MLEYCYICFNFECPKVCKTLKHLMFAIEAPNSAKGCLKKWLIEIKFKWYFTTWRLITIATWFIQGYPYPQSSRFCHLTIFGHIRPRTSFFLLIGVYVCMFLCSIYIYIYTIMQQKLFSVIYKLKYCKVLMHLMYVLETPNLTKVCTR